MEENGSFLLRVSERGINIAVFDLCVIAIILGGKRVENVRAQGGEQ